MPFVTTVSYIPGHTFVTTVSRYSIVTKGRVIVNNDISVKLDLMDYAQQAYNIIGREGGASHGISHLIAHKKTQPACTEARIFTDLDIVINRYKFCTRLEETHG